MNIKKAIKLYKQNMTFGDIMELCDLTDDQIRAIDYGMRSNQPESKIVKVANETYEDMKGSEIEGLFT